VLAGHLHPRVLPWHARPLCRSLNARLLGRQLAGHLDTSRGAWVTLATNPLAWHYRAELPGPFVYLRLDDYPRLPGVDAAMVAPVEREVLRGADLVVATARDLLPERREGPSLYLPQGVDAGHFARRPLSSRDSRVLGFFGLVAEWLDFELVEAVAAARPDWTLEFRGPVRYAPPGLMRRPNIVMRDAVDYAELPAVLGHWRAAWIPFQIDEMTEKVNPLKAREYMAAGLPSASTPLPEVEPLAPAVSICRSVAEVLDWLDALERRDDAAEAEELRRVARHHSWEVRAETLAREVRALGAGADGGGASPGRGAGRPAHRRSVV
jgi:hypothetical protein